MYAIRSYYDLDHLQEVVYGIGRLAPGSPCSKIFRFGRPVSEEVAQPYAGREIIGVAVEFAERVGKRIVITSYSIHYTKLYDIYEAGRFIFSKIA